MNETKFDGMGVTYSKFRPAYPTELIDYLSSEIGVTKNCVIADIGSGTGIFTSQLLEKGNSVYAIEPNADMRIIAEADLRKFNGFTSVNGSAENTTLPQNSVDIITVAQAFHWFDRKRFRAECKRIIKHNGKVVIVYNSRDEASELVRENDLVIRKYCPNFKGYSGGMRGAESEDDFKDFFTGAFDTKIFRNDLTFDETGFVGRNLSGTYALKESDNDYPLYVAELKALFTKYSNNGYLVMPNLTRSYVGSV